MTNHSDDQITIGMLALCRFSGVRPRMFGALMAHFGSLDRILKADAGSLMTVSGLTANAANQIVKASSRMEQAEKYLDLLRARDIDVLDGFNGHYPELLFELNDPPTLLYYQGQLPQPGQKTVALTGTQSASVEGLALTAATAKKMAEAGVQVVSPLKQGNAAAALLACKSAGGKSFAVLNGGLEQIEPEENRPLAVDIAQTGGLISEYPPEQKTEPLNYKAANRIIAALAQAVVITEFYKDSVETVDLLTCCNQIGKLVFVLVDARPDALTDKVAFDRAVTCGAITQVGPDNIDDLIKSLV